jgi:hypothetical protein
MALDDGIEKVTENLVAILISGNYSNGLDHVMATIVHANLDAPRQPHAKRRL